MDYVAAARYDQMERCYGMSMEEFGRRGFGWFMKSATMHFRRPLKMGEKMVVRCWIEAFSDDGVRLGFEIDRASNRKRVFEGHCDYTLVALSTGRAEPLTAEIREKYSI
jgi:acyl-CoA thioester hydrolase/thioesterase-3